MPAMSRARPIVALGRGMGMRAGEELGGGCCAAVANSHGFDGGWEVARGKMRPFYAKMILLRTQPPFSAQCQVLKM